MTETKLTYRALLDSKPETDAADASPALDATADPAYHDGLPFSLPEAQRTLAVDFDGVLHTYDKGWQGGMIYGEPVDGAVDAVNYLIRAGWTIIVHTSREELRAVREWLYANFGRDFVVTRIKPPAVAYIDDRAVRFTNWEDIRKLFA
jgi:hypothetical protein